NDIKKYKSDRKISLWVMLVCIIGGLLLYFVFSFRGWGYLWLFATVVWTSIILVKCSYRITRIKGKIKNLNAEK
ncbi:unnamed protein product, partial [marine sediment metagenome]